MSNSYHTQLLLEIYVAAGLYFEKLNIISNFCLADKSDLSSISQSLEADGKGIFEEWQGFLL